MEFKPHIYISDDFFKTDPVLALKTYLDIYSEMQEEEVERLEGLVREHFGEEKVQQLRKEFEEWKKEQDDEQENL